MLRVGLLIVTVITLITGCAVAPPKSPETLPDHYTVDGRVSVRKDTKPFQANFSWIHDGAADRIDVSNAFGQVLARLEMGPQRAAFFDANGKQHLADDIETLSETELGWRLPARGLRYWLLGLADPADDSSWLESAEGRTLLQDGWRIDFPGLNAGQSQAPAKLFLVRPGLEVRIALYNWQLTHQDLGAADTDNKP